MLSLLGMSTTEIGHYNLVTSFLSDWNLRRFDSPLTSINEKDMRRNLTQRCNFQVQVLKTPCALASASRLSTQRSPATAPPSSALMKAILACVLLLGLSPALCRAQTTILASNVGNPDNIIVDASSVYWDDLYTGKISSVSVNPGGAVIDYPVAMVGGGDLAQDSASLYFAGAANAGPYLSEHFVYKTSKAGGLTNTISNGMDHGFAYGGSLTIGPAGGILYYIGGARSIPGEVNNLYFPVVSLSTQGGSDNALIYDDPQSLDEAIFQQDGLRYWTGGLPSHFSTDSTYLYWSDSDTTTIWQTPLVGGPATAIVSGRSKIQVIATPI